MVVRSFRHIHWFNINELNQLKKMSSQISNIMSLDDHVTKINLAKSKVKISIFEMAEAITNAINQLENRQTELANKLGMSKGTLSKWLSIGSSNSLISVKRSAPTSFDSLYQLSALDNQYQKYFGKEKGSKNFLKLFESKKITSSSQRKDVIKFLKLHKNRINKKENTKVEKLNEPKINSEIKLKVLVKSKLFFNTIIVIPSNDQLNKWCKFGSIEDINNDYPIKSLENIDKNIFQQCLIKVKAKNIDIAIICLKSWGFNYDKILIPTQPKKGLVEVALEFVLIIGSKGNLKNNEFILKSNKTIDLIEYAQKTGAKPFLFIGEVLTTKNWIYCID